MRAGLAGCCSRRDCGAFGITAHDHPLPRRTCRAASAQALRRPYAEPIITSADDPEAACLEIGEALAARTTRG